MFWFYFVLFVIVVAVIAHFRKPENIDNVTRPTDDLTEEEIEYDYLQQEEREQEEEDEYWAERQDK